MEDPVAYHQRLYLEQRTRAARTDPRSNPGPEDEVTESGIDLRYGRRAYSMVPHAEVDAWVFPKVKNLSSISTQSNSSRGM